ncbi:hypothetical protein JCM11641_001777 [Rhodosporidiobolus odoratus]
MATCTIPTAYQPGKPPLLLQTSPSGISSFSRAARLFFRQKKIEADEDKISYLGEGLAGFPELYNWYNASADAHEAEAYKVFVADLQKKALPRDFVWEAKERICWARQDGQDYEDWVTAMRTEHLALTEAVMPLKERILMMRHCCVIAELGSERTCSFSSGPLHHPILWSNTKLESLLIAFVVGSSVRLQHFGSHPRLITISSRTDISEVAPIPATTSSRSSSSSSSTSSLSSLSPSQSPPRPRRSLRFQRAPSYGPSDLDTFITAQRSITRSTRFNNLPQLPSSPFSMALPIPADANLSDTAGVWQGEQAPSVASSIRSVNSQARREQAAEAFRLQSERRRLAFEAQEAKMRQERDEAMSAADVKSEMGRGNPPPQGSAVEAEAEVMQRRLADLQHEARALERMIAHRTNPLPTPPSPILSSVPVVSPLASFGVKIKVKEPKPWTGEFDMVKREGWIKTVALYFAGLELDIKAVLDEHLTPFPFYTLRSLFSSDVANGSISPQAWFDARNSCSPFTSVEDVFKALRAHGADDHAAELALSRYRAARQGSLRARDFGASLDALADACYDRKIDDLDRRTTFVAGLQPAVQDFVRTQMASLKALGKEATTFDEVVKMAALTDGLASFSAKKPTSASPSSNPPKKSNANEVPSNSSFPSPATPRAASTWTQDAQVWQWSHPVATKADWFDARGRSTNEPVQCYNCGDLSTHFSRSCTAARKDPKGIVVVMLSKLRISSSSPTPSAPPAPSVPDIASANRFESLSESEGKADEE